MKRKQFIFFPGTLAPNSNLLDRYKFFIHIDIMCESNLSEVNSALF